LFTSVGSICFFLTAILAVAGIVTALQSKIWGFGSSLLSSLTFVIMMVCLDYIAPEERKIWSHIGLVFAILYTTIWGYFLYSVKHFSEINSKFLGCFLVNL
jgi:succinate dehydrogenase hydrophobic anchor subunit